MISFDFEYYRPSSVVEAVRLYRELSQEGKHPLYYSGGTEIITFGRINVIQTGAVIDVKGIPECRMMGYREGKLLIGSALTLSEIYDARVFPLLGETANGVADRTSRNKITLGGNICSLMHYREAALPLLLTDSLVRIAGPGGLREVPIGDVFNQSLRLGPGEFIVQVSIDRRFLQMPYAVVKRRKQASVDYPLLTLAVLQGEEGIRAAFSNVCAFPFRSRVVEESLNNKQLLLESRVDEALTRLPAPILSDIRGSAEYRAWILKQTLLDTLEKLGGA